MYPGHVLTIARSDYVYNKQHADLVNTVVFMSYIFSVFFF